MNDPDCEPVFIISVAARLLEMHPQTLRKYEREGLIAPSRTTGNLRLYSDEDLDRLRQVKFLVNERGLNLAGVQMIVELTRHMQALQEQLATTAATEGNASLERASNDLTTLLRVLGSNSRHSGDQARSPRSRS